MGICFWLALLNICQIYQQTYLPRFLIQKQANSLRLPSPQAKTQWNIQECCSALSISMINHPPLFLNKNKKTDRKTKSPNIQRFGGLQGGGSILSSMNSKQYLYINSNNEYMQVKAAAVSGDSLLGGNGIKRQCETDRTSQTHNLFAREEQQLRAEAISFAQMNRKRSRKALQLKTPSELIKDNILKMRQNRRINSLKELTHQNVKLYYRIQAKQSEYKFDQLHKDSICELSRPRSRVNLASEHSQQGEGLTRSQSVMSSIRIRCTSAQRSIASSKVTLQPTLETDKQTPPHLLSKLSFVYDKENREQNLEQKEQTNYKKIVIDKETANRLLSKKMGLKIPMEDMKSFKSKTILNDKENYNGTAQQIALHRKGETQGRSFKRLQPGGILTERQGSLYPL